MRTHQLKGNLLDARRQNRLAARLRAMPEDRAFQAITSLIARDPKVGLTIANRVLHARPLLEEILRQGLRTSNESTSRFWLESLAPRLGAVRLLQIIREQAATDPAIAAKALYWLPSLVKGERNAVVELNRLRRDFKPDSA